MNSSIVAVELAWRVAVAVGKKLKWPASRAYILFRTIDFLAYNFMRFLLSLAVTMPFSIPLGLLASYFYAYHLLASNVYSTHLPKLLFEVRA